MEKLIVHNTEVYTTQEDKAVWVKPYSKEWAVEYLTMCSSQEDLLICGGTEGLVYDVLAAGKLGENWLICKNHEWSDDI